MTDAKRFRVIVPIGAQGRVEVLAKDDDSFLFIVENIDGDDRADTSFEFSDVDRRDLIAALTAIAP